MRGNGTGVGSGRSEVVRLAVVEYGYVAVFRRVGILSVLAGASFLLVSDRFFIGVLIFD